MKTLRKSINKIFALFLIIGAMFIFIGIFLFKPMKTVLAEKGITIGSTEHLELEKYKPTITDDFKDDRIIVTLTSEYSAVNKPLVYQDFKTESLALSQDVELLSMESDSTSKEADNSNKILIEEIEDLTYITEPSKIKMEEDFSQIVEITLENPGKENVLTAIEELEKLDWVLAAEPSYNYEVVENASKNDSFYEEQWGLHGINGIQAEQAWELVSGETTPRIKVGIFEAGIQEDHRDLRVIEGSFTPSANAETGHGTHVAGIIGAISGNAMGVAGIAPVEIALLDCGNFVSSIVWAINNDIQIINASFYYAISSSNTSPAPADTSHATAIRIFEVYGGILIAAAGNQGSNTDTMSLFPAGYGDSRYYPNISNVISVGAINSNGARSSFSNYGINSVQIYAPGGNIYSTLPGHSYGTNSGTSMAAPHVAGVAALLLAEDPTLTASELKDKILESADTITITIPDGSTQTVKKLNAFNLFNEIEFETTDIGEDRIQINGAEQAITGKLVIPQTINGREVVALINAAFKDQTQITEVVLPETLISIGSMAFKGCTSLTTIRGMKAVVAIGNGAFRDCSALTSVLGMESVINIGNYAFMNCTALTSITVPVTLQTIHMGAFSGAANLVTFKIKENGDPQLTTIKSTAFNGCSKLANFGVVSTNYLNLPSSVTTIEASAFRGTAFKFIAIGANVRTIGDAAFSNMAGLLDIYVDDGNLRYADVNSALYDCLYGSLMKFSSAKGSTSFTVPETVKGVPITRIELGAFNEASNLVTVDLGNVTYIERNAFLNCSALTTFTSTDKLETIEEFALDGTAFYNQAGDFVSLGEVLYKYKGTASVLNATDFPTGVTRFMRYAFYMNTNLQTVNLPTTTEYIGNNVFYYCINLTAVRYTGNSLPQVGSDSFLGLADGFKFYCAQSLIDSVTETSAWYAYLDIMAPIG